jgi:membrane fusion protein (multidrug efflux system)
MRFFAGVVAALALLLNCALAAAPPPPAVTIATVEAKNVAPSHTFYGRITPIHAVSVVPRVTAFIESVPVKQGSDVKAGEVLFELQKTQYQAAVQSAQAQLASAKAALENAQLTYMRAKRLANEGFEAQANFDAATATRDQDQAQVLAAEASVTQAALNLSYCTIISPIDGRIGPVTLTKGNLVTPSTPALATINQLDPIRVVFSVSDSVLVSFEQRTGATQSDISREVAVNLILPNGKLYNQSGKIAFLSNQVDPNTGTVSVYADFPNPNALLLPGAYVTVEVSPQKPEERPVVPVAAVQTDQSGSYVLVVGPDNKVRQQVVTLGQQIAQDYIVDKGVTGGERVIIAGQEKVRPGETVTPTPASTAAAETTSPQQAHVNQGT